MARYFSIREGSELIGTCWGKLGIKLAIAHQYDQNPPLNAHADVPNVAGGLFLIMAFLFIQKLCAQEMRALTRLCIIIMCRRD